MQRYHHNKLSVVIGRFSPLHNGHIALFEKAVDDNSDLLIIVGSANSARTVNNPFTVEERVGMIKTWFNQPVPFGQGTHDITIATVDDSDYDYQWWQNAVMSVIQKVAGGRPVTVYGHYRDNSSYYLRDVKYHEVGALENNVSATSIREQLYTLEKVTNATKELVPLSTATFLEGFVRKCTEWCFVYNEFDRARTYRSMWSNAKWPPVFITADATVFCGNKVLLIQRKGTGQWAVPGGFLGQDESVEDCARRELEEETSLKLYGIKPSFSEVFDQPDRDPRGRIVTHNFVFIVHGFDPYIKAGDDAMNAEWKTMDWVRSNPRSFYADHFKMINLLAVKTGIAQQRSAVSYIQTI